MHPAPRLVLALGFALGCGTSTSTITTPPLDPAEPAEESITALDQLQSLELWDALAYRPEYQTAARTEVVKLVIDLQHDWRIYFLNSSRYELHYSFVKEHLDPSADHAAFNTRQYRRDDREYVLASLVHYLDGDFWTFELVAGDILDAERIQRAFTAVQERVFFGDAMRFRPLSPMQVARVDTLGEDFPVIYSDELMANMSYQALVPGTAFGHIRIVRGELDLASVSPNDLLVTERVPDELPPVSGLITSTLQAPLAHVAILSRNRGTPDMTSRGAVDDPRFTALEGQLVRLDVGPQDFTLVPATLEQAEAHWAGRRPANGFTPEFDLSVNELREVCELRTPNTNIAGAKASQLGEVCAMGDIETPGGFVVPFARYQAHLGTRLQGQIESMLVDSDFRTSSSGRAQTLEELRSRILAARVDPALVRAVRRRLASSESRFIFRSSTNAEDLVGFNGAGLYQSVVVDSRASSAQIADALRTVWASVWLQRAFEEREWYRIDHAAVKMAVLIQPFVDDVIGSGVAVTRNPFDEGRPGQYVNIQTSAEAVTSAVQDELPEQVIIYTWTEELEFELVSRSTRTGGEAILSEDDLRSLGEILKKLNDRLVPTYSGGANAVDVELLLTRGERRFVIVQARPITIEYSSGQAWRTP